MIFSDVWSHRNPQKSNSIPHLHLYIAQLLTPTSSFPRDRNTAPGERAALLSFSGPRNRHPAVSAKSNWTAANATNDRRRNGSSGKICDPTSWPQDRSRGSFSKIGLIFPYLKYRSVLGHVRPEVDEVVEMFEFVESALLTLALHHGADGNTRQPGRRLPIRSWKN